MKPQFLYKLTLIALLVTLASCDDTLRQVGFGIQPQDDKLMVATDTLYLGAQTVKVESIFSRTKYPVLGEYSDPVFGSIKSEYMGEFFYAQGTSFKEGAVIDSVKMMVSYSSLIGDSLTPMNLSVYQINKSLPQNQDYTNINPKDYADMSAPLGKKTFTGKNTTYRKEVIGSGYNTQTITVYDIKVPLPKTIGDSFLEEYKKPNHGVFKTADTFRKYFPGLYVTTSFGNSTIMNIEITSLYVHYHYLDKGGSSQKTDTTRTAAFRLNMTPEVSQINYVQTNNDRLLASNPNNTYVKSPAGVNTEITFPTSKLHAKLKNQALNQAKFVVYALPEANEDTQVKLSPPAHLLLINKDSLAGFFEKRKLPDNITSYLGNFNRVSYSYDFGNISAMINHYKEANKNKATGEYTPFDLKYYLVSVDITFEINQYGQRTSTVIAAYNQMQPAAVMLDKREKSLKLEMIFTRF